MNQTELEVNTCNRRQARENACEQGTIGFGFASHWSRKWHEFCEPITEHTKPKPKQTRISLILFSDAQLKTAP